MRKTFIEAMMSAWVDAHIAESLPLMRKTFIEASNPAEKAPSQMRLFRLCGRLSLRPIDNPQLPSHVGSLPLMQKTFIEAPVAHDGCTSTRCVSSAYAEDFH